MKRTIFWLLAALIATAPGVVPAAGENGNLEALRQTAQKGDVAAQYELGVLYEFGFNMENNRVHALAWYMLAADGGNERAATRRDLLQGQLRAAEVDDAKRMKMEFKAPATPAAPAPADDATPATPETPKP